MTAPKPTEEQIAWAKWWTLDDGWAGWEELADRLSEREAAAEQRGREAGIREAASRAAQWVRDAASDDEAGEIEEHILLPLRTHPSAKPLTGPELAQKYGSTPLAESGAARVPGVDAGPADDEEPDR